MHDGEVTDIREVPILILVLCLGECYNIRGFLAGNLLVERTFLNGLVPNPSIKHLNLEVTYRGISTTIFQVPRMGQLCGGTRACFWSWTNTIFIPSCFV